MTELEHHIHAAFGIGEQDIEKISLLFQPMPLCKGDFLLKAGRYAGHLAFIKTGLLRIYAEKDGREITQWISEPGYFVTDLSSLVFQTPARWNIQALTPVELYAITRSDYQQLGKLVPDWHHLEKLFIAKCFTILENRIFSHLSMTAEERYRQLCGQHGSLLAQVPLNYLASMLGMSPETISRIRARKIS